MKRLLLSLLLLAGRNDPPKQQDATDLAVETGEHAIQIQQLQERLDKLETKEAGDKFALDMEQASASTSFDSLRGTFNNNVKLDNERAAGTLSMMQSIDDRLSRYDGQHSTR